MSGGQPMVPAHGGGYNRAMPAGSQSSSLADLLERVLDKGIVIAGDITVSLGQVDLLQIKIRLLITSVDKAREIGINWWQSDPALSGQAGALEAENRQLRERLERLEARLAQLPPPPPSQDGAARDGHADPPAEEPPKKSAPRKRAPRSR